MADAIPGELWAQQPGPEQWSAAQVVGHLVVVERAIIGKADSVAQRTPLRIPRLKRMHLPLWLVQARVIRRKSPLPLDDGLIAEKETMLGELRGARERTFAFLSETQGRNLDTYYWRHPFLGMLNTYEWMEMIAAHQLRHAKQVREIHGTVSRKW